MRPCEPNLFALAINNEAVLNSLFKLKDNKLDFAKAIDSTCTLFVRSTFLFKYPIASHLGLFS